MEKSQLIKSNMFTEGENVWTGAVVEMTAPCREKNECHTAQDELEACCFILLSKCLMCLRTSGIYNINES